MFKIKKQDICPLTGYVDYEIEFSVYGGPARITKGTFNSKAQADRKITEMKRDYLLFTIEKLVFECKQLWERGDVKNTTGRVQAFTKLNDGLHYLQDKDIFKMSDIILQLDPFLKYILPPETNDRYNFLYSQKLRLINFSKELINQKTELCRV